MKRTNYRIRNSKSAFEYLARFYPEDTIHLKEYFMVMYVNRQNSVLGVYRLSEGGLSATVADVRLVLAVALKTAAHGIILSHNHPSGELQPSSHDLEMTKRVKDACNLMDIRLLDHIILGGEGTYISLMDEGLI
jgi:DNA repair protein RadC